MTNNVGRVQSHPRTEGPFEHLMMDFIELNPCEGNKYCLVIVDTFSKWIEGFLAGELQQQLWQRLF